jgi:hypothetical protein
MSIIFDYTVFYNKYTNNPPDQTNMMQLHSDNTVKPYLHYYKKLYPSNQVSDIKLWPTNYIIVGGVNVYISSDINNRLYFTIPYQHGNIFYDNHYHFGTKIIRDSTVRHKNICNVSFLYIFNKNV